MKTVVFNDEANFVFLSLSLALLPFSPFLFCSAMSGKVLQEEVTENGPCVQVESIPMDFMFHLIFIL